MARPVWKVSLSPVSAQCPFFAPGFSFLNAASDVILLVSFPLSGRLLLLLRQSFKWRVKERAIMFTNVESSSRQISARINANSSLHRLHPHRRLPPWSRFRKNRKNTCPVPTLQTRSMAEVVPLHGGLRLWPVSLHANPRTQFENDRGGS